MHCMLCLCVLLQRQEKAEEEKTKISDATARCEYGVLCRPVSLREGWVHIDSITKPVPYVLLQGTPTAMTRQLRMHLRLCSWEEL